MALPNIAAADLVTSTAVTDPVNVINIGSRKSKLALIQTDIVHKALKEAWPDLDYEIHAMSTIGDKNQVTALHDFGAKSLWTHELEALLVEGKLDLIVHSLKDMPTQLPHSCTIGAILPREDACDALVMKSGLSYSSIQSLPEGSIVGTSSVRRSAQVARGYPHLRFKDVRGNVGTRLSKLDDKDGEYACLILAAAGLKRLDLGHRITQYLDSQNGGLLHAVGQGALGVEIREGDERIMKILCQLADRPTTLACLAERSLLRTLEGGCSVPIGVETEWLSSGMLKMRAVVVSLDGQQSVDGELEEQIETDAQADAFGRTLSQKLIEAGAADILAEKSEKFDGDWLSPFHSWMPCHAHVSAAEGKNSGGWLHGLGKAVSLPNTVTCEAFRCPNWEKAVIRDPQPYQD